ncbi:hypothetical protein F0P96_03885 [Hymenobacter busanensis]|uniref:Uncharacterized protein n=1 Tax=Hymenobacter busanensis TaxID=2607656 RepID=A0A7L4ZT06_9BACT|nr:hypothetical protein [Hymenobacter busanensis]KAA9339766.1 hypothetical protein F0P96_03885 [Hymenobacter busanensis]QHJ06479.1 hypothetical protein GUY19_03860 [Hymenobacter busanensis]
MINNLTKNCTNESQLEKVRRGQELKFRWRDDWPVMEQEILKAGREAIARYEESHQNKQAQSSAS